MFRKNKVNIFFLFLFFLLISGSVYSVIWNFMLKTNLEITQQNNKINKSEKEITNEKEIKELFFDEYAIDLFKNLNKSINNSIILDNNFEKINEYKEEYFKFDKKKFEMKIIKIISQKMFKFNLKIINKENEKEQFSKNFRISIN